jgi:hypothetical protein
MDIPAVDGIDSKLQGADGIAATLGCDPARHNETLDDAYAARDRDQLNERAGELVCSSVSPRLNDRVALVALPLRRRYLGDGTCQIRAKGCKSSVDI